MFRFGQKNMRVLASLLVAAFITGTVAASAYAVTAETKQPTLPGDTIHGAITPAPRHQLHGAISVLHGPDPVCESIDSIVAESINCSEGLKNLDKACDKYKGMHRRLWAMTRDAANYVLEYRGGAPSSEAGDIILDEKNKLMSRASAEYQRQRYKDELKLEVVTNIFQIAHGLGMSDRKQGQAEVQSAFESLEQLVGNQKAQETIDRLTDWSKTVIVPESVYRQGEWGVKQRREKLKSVMLASMDKDPVVKEIVGRVHRYNSRSKLSLATSRIVKTSLGIAGMTPSLVGPAAQIALFGFVMLTGGSEEDKLLKELYLDKRLDSRSRVLVETAHMALESHQLARLTRNPVLLSCSESVLCQMAGSSGMDILIGADSHNSSKAGRSTAEEQTASAGDTESTVSSDGNRPEILGAEESEEKVL